jgi:hypothetical protein
MSEIQKYNGAEPPLVQTIKDAEFMAARMPPRDVKSVRRGRITSADGSIEDYQEITYRRQF